MIIKTYIIRISFSNIRVLKQTTTDHYKRTINFKLIKCIIAVQYYLCLFFTVCTDAKSFKSIYIIEKTLHSTFQAVCIALSLLEDDGEWISCFEEIEHVVNDRA